MAKKVFERCLWCKKVVLLKHRDKTCGQKGLQHSPTVVRQLIIYFGLEGSKIREVPKGPSYAKENLEDPGGLAISKLR